MYVHAFALGFVLRFSRYLSTEYEALLCCVGHRVSLSIASHHISHKGGGVAELGCLESVLVCVRCLGWAEDGGLGVDCGVVVVLLLLLVLFLLLVLGWRDLFWILLSYESGEWLSEILKLR